MLIGILGVSFFGNMLTGKGILRAGYGNKERKGILRTGCRSKSSNSSLFFNKYWNPKVLW